MTDAEKIAAWDALAAEAQRKPTPEEVETEIDNLCPHPDIASVGMFGTGTIVAAIQHERRLAARAAVLAELRERELREALEAAAMWLGVAPNEPKHSCGPDAGCDGDCVDYARAVDAMSRLRAALAAPSGPGVLAHVVEALRLAQIHAPPETRHNIDVALRALGEEP